jgi:hypothetical protein
MAEHLLTQYQKESFIFKKVKGAPVYDSIWTQISVLEIIEESPSSLLLPGPNTGCLQILRKNPAKWEKIRHFCKNMFLRLWMIKSEF